MQLLFLDTETTGVGPEDRILQVAYKLGVEQTCNKANFKPSVPIKLEAKATHHITERDLENCEPFAGSIMQGELKEYGEMGIIPVIHNAAFDLDMLAREDVKFINHICTLKLAKTILDLPNYQLQYLRYYFNIELAGINPHDAESDVLVLEQVYNYLAMELSAQNPDMDASLLLEKMITISKNPLLLKKIHFGKYRGTPFAEIPKDYLQWLKDDRAKKPPEQPDPDLDNTLDYYLKPKKQPATLPL